MKRIKLISGDEYDALTSARKHCRFGPGVAKRIKLKYNRRLRKANRRATEGMELAALSEIHG